jgi:hypothetical protein
VHSVWFMDHLYPRSARGPVVRGVTTATALAGHRAHPARTPCCRTDPATRPCGRRGRSLSTTPAAGGSTSVSAADRTRRSTRSSGSSTRPNASAPSSSTRRCRCSGCSSPKRRRRSGDDTTGSTPRPACHARYNARILPSTSGARERRTLPIVARHADA